MAVSFFYEVERLEKCSAMQLEAMRCEKIARVAFVLRRCQRSIELMRRGPLNLQGTGAGFMVRWMLEGTDARVGVVYGSVPDELAGLGFCMGWVTCYSLTEAEPIVRKVGLFIYYL